MPDLLVWIYNSRTGAVVELPSPTATIELKSGLGWHGPFSSKQAALDYYERNRAANPGWKEPTGWQGNLENAPGAAKDFLNPLSGVLAPFGVIFSKNLWIRVAEFTIGAILLAIGANAIVKQTTGVDVGGTAKQGAKIAAVVAK